MKEHWDKVYKRTAHNNLGWYEDYPEPSIELIDDCELTQDSRLLVVGAGASKLIDELLSKGYTNIFANDLSIKALESNNGRMGPLLSKQVKWIVDDLTKPIELNDMDPIDLWHDRAVLHFFNDPDDQDSYFSLLRKLLRIGGHAIIASFNLNGAEKCSGLPVHRYNAEILTERIGPDFELIKSFEYVHSMPGGDSRDYIYTLFRRTTAED